MQTDDEAGDLAAGPPRCPWLDDVPEDLKGVVAGECHHCRGLGPTCAIERMTRVLACRRPTVM